MPAIVLIGAQWGDEGKGKATDLLGDQVQYVVRYQGGNNAGHTVVIGDEKYALHVLPSGVLSPDVTPVIGNGVVIDPKVLFEEVDALAARGVSCDRLLVSASAHLIMPYHTALDKVSERFLGQARIGTTGRGIGPTYGDKIARIGIRVQDLSDPGILRQKLELALREKNQVLTKVYNRRAVDPHRIADEYLAYGERLRPYVADVGLVLGHALDNGETVLLEGAQGSLLDIDHGTYPFVTSSNPTAGGACVGSGIGPTRISKVIGIVKAYTTRVGSGPFPTELNDESGEYLRKAGGEFGVTTGRARRCGWFDAVIARYATRVNGVTDFFVTKLDVLSSLDKVPVCVAYEVDGKRYDEIPMTQTEFHHAKPVYEYLDGWFEDITEARSFEDLPKAARDYVRTVEELSGAPVAAVGVGPRRDQTLQLRPLLLRRSGPGRLPKVRVLVIGGGGREHAIVRALAADPAVTELHAAPGNPGISELAQLHAVAATDPADVVRLARAVAAGLVVVGPEAPLVAGVADALRQAGITVFGPDAAAARIEGSKAFAKDIMVAAGIPTAEARVCTTPAEAAMALDEFGPPYVVKDDALAAGKGVVVTDNLDEATAHAAACPRVVIEEYLDGPEVSLFALADGTTAVPLLPAQDFKRAGDGDRGPNTGGMGAYVPLSWAPPGLTNEVMGTVVGPAITELARRGTPYTGLLYVGLALTSKGVKVVEFNARFGDPETQVVLDRLATPLSGLLHAASTGDLAAAPRLTWRPGAAVTVVLAAEDYPEAPARGDVITLGPLAPDVHGYLLHAGTARSGPDLVTAGGRVLNAVGAGADLAAARDAAYAVAESVRFRGCWYRHDIALAAAAAAAG